MFRYKDLIGHTLTYSDKGSGTSWNIEVFETYRSEIDDATILVLTDSVKVEMRRFDTLRGTTHIIDKILETYGNAMNNLEYSNV